MASTDTRTGLGGPEARDLRGGSVDHGGAPAVTGGAALAAVYLRAREAWPAVTVSRQAFEEHVRARLGDEAPGAHGEDLYLACACLLGAPGAEEEFHRVYLADIGSVLRGIDSSAGFTDEVRQILWEKLFATPKLADYSGRGPLANWVGVAAQRIALSLKRREAPRQAMPLPSADQLVAPGSDPELTYLRARYRPQLEEALAAALRSLSERERMILRLNLVGGATYARIGAMYRVNQSTVSRWFAAARERVSAALGRELRARLGIAAAEVQSLVRVVQDDFDLSLSRILASGDD